MFDDEAGWVAIAGLLDQAAIAAVLDDCRRLLAAPAESRAAGDKMVGGTLHLNELDRRADSVARLASDVRLVAVVESILGPSSEVMTIGYRSPQPGYGSQYLHADAVPQLVVEPANTATAIVALTEFTSDNGATRLVPGSHRRPDLQRHGGKLANHRDEIRLLGEAGTAFVFSGHVLHSGTINESQHERPALQLVWRRRQ